MAIDSPYAFPGGTPSRFNGSVNDGMTLRDWFASHADQPGVSEIVTMAGHRTDGFWVEFADGSEKAKFNDWWNGLPLPERCLLSARVRFALADAMLAARAATPATGGSVDG